MRKSSTFKGAVAAILIFGLLLSGGVFAYTSRIQASHTNSSNQQLVSDDDNGEGDKGSHGQTSTTQTTSEAETENSDSEHSQESNHLNFALVPAPLPTGTTAPAGYSFGHGNADVQVEGSSLKVQVEIRDAAPNTTFSIVITLANETSASSVNRVALGNITTNDKGEGQTEAQTSLGPGVYQIGVVLLDETNFGSTMPAVIQSDPLSRTITLPGTVQSQSETETETKSEDEGKSGHELKFRIVPATDGASGQGEANIAIHGTVLKVDVEIAKAAPSTTYNISLLVFQTSGPTGTTVSPPAVSSSTTTSATTTSTSTTATNELLGTIVTNDEGEGHLHTEIRLAAGTYQLGIALSASGATQLVSDPRTDTAVVSGTTTPGSEEEGKGNGQANHVVKGEKQDEDEIKNAEDSRTIPAVVQVTSSGSVATVLDPRFSVSIGKVGENGLAVSISASNVTGPRVLLINLTGNTIDLSSHSLNVSLDGRPVVEASSVTQVLNPSATDPPRYLIVTTTSGSQLLVSIPHFSLHVLQVLPVTLVQAEASIPLNAELVAAGVLAIAVVSVIAYKMRGTHPKTNI